MTTSQPPKNNDESLTVTLARDLWIGVMDELFDFSPKSPKSVAWRYICDTIGATENVTITFPPDIANTLRSLDDRLRLVEPKE